MCCAGKMYGLMRETYSACTYVGLEQWLYVKGTGILFEQGWNFCSAFTWMEPMQVGAGKGDECWPVQVMGMG